MWHVVRIVNNAPEILTLHLTTLSISHNIEANIEPVTAISELTHLYHSRPQHVSLPVVWSCA